MKPAAAVLLTSLLCATVSCGQTSAPTKADPSLTYEVVSKNPAKYAGKRVTWTGTNIYSETTSDATGKNVQERMAFSVRTKEDGIHVFGVIGEKRPQETEAAQKLSHTSVDPNIRKVTGTVSKKITEFRNQPDGTLITAVVLTDAVVDAPDPEPKK